MAYAGSYEAQKAQLQMEVDQLKIQYKMHQDLGRVKLSTTIKEMINYSQRGLAQDPLVYPVKNNPFVPKKSCVIL